MLKVLLLFLIMCGSVIAQDDPYIYPEHPQQVQPEKPGIPINPQYRESPCVPCVPYVPLVPNFYRHHCIGPDGHIYTRWSWYWGL